VFTPVTTTATTTDPTLNPNLAPVPPKLPAYDPLIRQQEKLVAIEKFQLNTTPSQKIVKDQ
jgi:hypothetical protein